MRVLHVLGSLDVGGAEMRTLEMFRQLSADDITFDVATLSGRRGALAEEWEGQGGRVFAMPLGPSFVPRFLRLLRRERFDAVHSHVATASGAILWLAKLAGVRIRVAHFRSDSDGRRDTRLRQVQRATLRRAIQRYATRVVGVTDSSLRFNYGSGWQHDARCSLLVNGLDLNRIKATASDDPGPPWDRESVPIVIHVGRSGPEKNRSRLIEILSELVRLRPAQLAIVGQVSEEEHAELTAEASRLGLDRVLHVLGPRRDAPNLIRLSDALILPSIREGLPGVVLEACALGVPVVATRMSGTESIQSVFPSVRLLDLEQSSREWAKELADSITERRTSSETLASTLEAFEDSPFGMSTVVRQYRALYTPMNGLESVGNDG